MDTSMDLPWGICCINNVWSPSCGSSLGYEAGTQIILRNIYKSFPFNEWTLRLNGLHNLLLHTSFKWWNIIFLTFVSQLNMPMLEYFHNFRRFVFNVLIRNISGWLFNATNRRISFCCRIISLYLNIYEIYDCTSWNDYSKNSFDHFVFIVVGCQVFLCFIQGLPDFEFWWLIIRVYSIGFWPQIFYYLIKISDLWV